MGNGGPILGGSRSFVGKVFANPTVPTTVPKFFDCHPVVVTGTPAEGGSGTLTPDTGVTVPVLVLGPYVPVANDFIIYDRVDDRWVSQDSVTSTVPVIGLAGCPCPNIPQTLTMSVTNPAANSNILQDCTLQYGAVPYPQMAGLALGTNAYLSTAWFHDDFTPDLFKFYFSCFQGIYVLSRVFPTSVYGSPYKDSNRYHWGINGSTNVCGTSGHGFHLNNGQIYTGGDPATVVTITGPP